MTSLKPCPPHLTEVLETEAYRIAEVLKARSAAVAKLVENADTGSGHRTLLQLAAVVLNSRGNVVQPLLSLSSVKEVEADDLAGKTIIVDARLGGLSAEGLLDSSAAEAPCTLDGTGEEISLWDEARLAAVGRRLRIVPPESEPAEGWVREAGWPTTLDEANEAPEEWRVERVVRALTEGDAARLRTAQALDQHLEWTAEEADRITSALGLGEEFRRMLHV